MKFILIAIIAICVSQGFAAPAEDGNVAANATADAVSTGADTPATNVTATDVAAPSEAVIPAVNVTDVAAPTEAVIPAVNVTDVAAPTEAVMPALNVTDVAAPAANSTTTDACNTEESPVITVRIIHFDPEDVVDSDASEDKAQDKDEDDKPVGGISGILRFLAKFLSKIHAKFLSKRSANDQAAATETKSDVDSIHTATDSTAVSHDDSSDFKLETCSIGAPSSADEGSAAEAA